MRKQRGLISRLRDIVKNGITEDRNGDSRCVNNYLYHINVNGKEIYVMQPDKYHQPNVTELIPSVDENFRETRVREQSTVVEISDLVPKLPIRKLKKIFDELVGW